MAQFLIAHFDAGGQIHTHIPTSCQLQLQLALDPNSLRRHLMVYISVWGPVNSSNDIPTHPAQSDTLRSRVHAKSRIWNMCIHEMSTISLENRNIVENGKWQTTHQTGKFAEINFLLSLSLSLIYNLKITRKILEFSVIFFKPLRACHIRRTFKIRCDINLLRSGNYNFLHRPTETLPKHPTT